MLLRVLPEHGRGSLTPCARNEPRAGSQNTWVHPSPGVAPNLLSGLGQVAFASVKQRGPSQL